MLALNRNNAVPTSIPAPVGGWNTREALDAMPPEDAVLLDNWYPDTGSCRVRDGYSSHSTGVGSGAVETLAELYTGSTRKLIAASSTNLYDASTSTASSIGGGFTSGRWQTENFNGRLFLVNGQDAPQDYDGTTLTATAWTGPTLTNLVGVNVFKNRLFFWESDSQDFWYAGVNAITGTLTQFPLSRVAGFGGNLVGMETWTIDGGNGLDDYAVFVLSSGDVVVYQGTDPGDATNWSLVGVYHIAPPINGRSVIKTAGDILIATRSDYVTLSSVLKSGQLGVASKMSGAVIEAVQNNGSGFGWQAIEYKSLGAIIINVPLTDGTYQQHVMNAITGAWCRFTDIKAHCFGAFNNGLYFGGDGGVVYQYGGTMDGASAINADARQAWNSFNTAMTKRLSAIRPIIRAQGTVSYSIAVDFDYRDSTIFPPSTSSAAGSAWDTSAWDTSAWSSEDEVNSRWQVQGGYGQALSTRLKVSASQQIAWLRTDYRQNLGHNL